MPLIGFGTWEAAGQSGYDAVRYALEAGYRHVDTATIYRNEEVVGRAVRESGIPREDVFVTTKLAPRDAGDPRKAIETSLSKLGLDHVDLWLIHWPPGGARPDVWEALLRARDDGLATHVGVSNYSVDQLDELIAATGQAPYANQIEYRPTLHDPVLLKEHEKRDVRVEGYSPLVNTRLTEDVLTGPARNHGVTPAQVVLKWHLQHGIAVIPKSVTPERIRQNYELDGFELTAAEMSAIDDRGTRPGR